MATFPQPGALVPARPLIFKRLLRFSHMDFEHAIWELGTLLVLPRKVYRQVYYQKQTKDRWARDDPAVVILFCGLLVSSSISWSIVKQLTLWRMIGLCLKMLLRDFLLVTLVSGSIIRVVVNTFMARGTTDTKMEWAYAFDLHINGFFVVFSWIYVLQLFLLPVVTAPRWPSLLLGNSIYCVAFVQYFYIVYLGLTALPFVKRANLVLLPLVLVLIAYIMSLSGYNIPVHALEMYFG
ncbi:hypothetical protein M408DRAFT_13534 [Serendipita vermifera MAFF 305830]|uniref:UNC-50-like protein n=1 Tax=Serendipita vermifera MAFF 305830 TaxID=933852 RepID=A0A0C2XXZ1_SERVB|nr:hypothetical protein M408DRAFT_13534 [Serendipita vermifera MAFF 305830]